MSKPLRLGELFAGYGGLGLAVEFLINLGHQIGHDLGGRCHIKDQLQAHMALGSVEIDPDEMPEEVREALGSLLEGLAEAARTTKGD